MPVKIGVLVLFAGVAAALRFAATEGYLTLPIGLRLSLIAFAALTALGFGWRTRRSRPVFALSLQGGAIGVLLLTTFAAYRLYSLLPPGMALALVVALVAGAALLAVLQRAMALAVLGFLGGYLAPVLLSTGSGNHIALFSYYAALNAAVFAISWRQHWRLLNLIGFAFTFGIGSLWFASAYTADLFWTVEPFLILFFLFYTLIGLLYTVRRPNTPSTAAPQQWLDGTLIFGTPLIAFPMQSVLLRDQPMALAFSALGVAAIYLGLLFWLRRRPQHRLLTEAYAALALGFATLAIPLAFSATTTASLWALEGVGLAWLGLRQQRKLPWLAGLALQPLAAVAYLLGEFGSASGDHPWLVLNSTFLGAAFLGFSGLALARIHDRHQPSRWLPPIFMLWGLGWWLIAGMTQVFKALGQNFGPATPWSFAVIYLGVGLILAGGLRRWLQWHRLGWAMALATCLVMPCVFWAFAAYDTPLALDIVPAFMVFLATWLIALWWHRKTAGRAMAVTHMVGLWALTLAVSLHADWLSNSWTNGWIFLICIAMLWLATLGLWRRPQWLAWPRSELFAGYRDLWFGVALPLLALAWLTGLVSSGDAHPLPYLPLLNPLELALIAIALLIWGFSRGSPLAQLTVLWAGVGFCFITTATLRVVHHYFGEPWSWQLLDSGLAHTSLTVVWSLLGVAAWVGGSRTGRRRLWFAGAGLMAVVLVKLILIDRQFMGNFPGIISFLAVGLLLVVVGYFAPSPPATDASEPAVSNPRNATQQET